jgi:beta-galactosidase
VFREVADLGKELENLSELLNADNPASVGIIFDWDNYWALEYTSGPNKDLQYVDQIHQYYRYFYEQNIPVDMIPIDADFGKYDAVIAPVLYMVKDGMKEALESYVNSGGILVTSFMSGIVDQSDNVHLGGYPGPLRKLAGIWAEEIDALAPEQSNRLRFADGTEGSCRLVCDIIHLETAVSLADYGSNFYAKTPAITRNVFGKGMVFYVGTQPDADSLAKTLDQVIAAAKIKPIIDESTKLEITCRIKGNKKYYFIINLRDEDFPIPNIFAGATDILSGKKFAAGEVMHPFDTALVRQY